MKTILISILIIVAACTGANYSFAKKGFYSERNKYCHCIAEGNYTGEVWIDSIFRIDPATLDEHVTMGYGNEKTGEWKYYDTSRTFLIGTIVYSHGDVLSKTGFEHDTINERVYDSIYDANLDNPGK
ncbi:MAG: hypothetical protein JSS76_12855 [Bacteroidetes bacterium]|nr:hypothetical protein [Bacteroidota bacterium]